MSKKSKPLTMRETRLITLLMKATEKHKGKRSHGKVGTNISCDCEPCRFVQYIWANMIWIEDIVI